MNDPLVNWLMGLFALAIAGISTVTYNKADKAKANSDITSERQKALSSRLSVMNKKLDEVESIINKIPARFAKLEAYSEQQGEILSRIESFLIRAQRKKRKKLFEDNGQENLNFTSDAYEDEDEDSNN